MNNPLANMLLLEYSSPSH